MKLSLLPGPDEVDSPLVEEVASQNMHVGSFAAGSKPQSRLEVLEKKNSLNRSCDPLTEKEGVYQAAGSSMKKPISKEISFRTIDNQGLESMTNDTRPHSKFQFTHEKPSEGGARMSQQDFSSMNEVNIDHQQTTHLRNKTTTAFEKSKSSVLIRESQNGSRLGGSTITAKASAAEQVLDQIDELVSSKKVSRRIRKQSTGTGKEEKISRRNSSLPDITP